jgi:hypothetical protein
VLNTSAQLTADRQQTQLLLLVQPMAAAMSEPTASGPLPEDPTKRQWQTALKQRKASRVSMLVLVVQWVGRNHAMFLSA